MIAEDEDFRVGAGFCKHIGCVVFAISAGEAGDEHAAIVFRFSFFDAVTSLLNLANVFSLLFFFRGEDGFQAVTVSFEDGFSI